MHKGIMPHFYQERLVSFLEKHQVRVLNSLQTFVMDHIYRNPCLLLCYHVYYVSYYT